MRVTEKRQGNHREGPSPGEDLPIGWAVTADGVLYTAQIPIREDGS